MSDLRQILIDKGWRQGVIVSPGHFGHQDSIGCLVLTQTCDCINPDFQKEPHLELLPLEKLTENPNSQLKNGKNPRQIHFQIQENGREIWVSAKIADIFQFDRAEHTSLTFASYYTLSRSSLDRLIHWRAQRYLRTAFPDSFELAFRSFAEHFRKKIENHESKIDSLLISLLPFKELEDGDRYEIQLHLMVTPLIMAQPETVQALQGLSKEIEQLLAESPAFDSYSCSVACLDEMNLWDARKFVDFTRYDYLSFGIEEGAI